MYTPPLLLLVPEFAADYAEENSQLFDMICLRKYEGLDDFFNVIINGCGDGCGDGRGGGDGFGFGSVYSNEFCGNGYGYAYRINGDGSGLGN